MSLFLSLFILVKMDCPTRFANMCGLSSKIRGHLCLLFVCVLCEKKVPSGDDCLQQSSDTLFVVICFVFCLNFV